MNSFASEKLRSFSFYWCEARESRIQKIQQCFRGYIFGRLDPESSGRSILVWIPGAIRIVNFGDEPVSISDHLINILRQHLETINAGGADIAREFR